MCDIRQWSGVLKVVNFIEVYFELRFADLSTDSTRILLRFNYFVGLPMIKLGVMFLTVICLRYFPSNTISLYLSGY